jgi:DNA-binding PadR family transcriptional regulator
VYPSLHRLEDAGLLQSEWEEIERRRRRVYRATAAGHTAASAERREWELFRGAVGRVLEGSV